ncbi:MAG TPA: pentapeptide repeat-containing protein, partial [Azonexus sp.]|nr:pentapeptide repeat-containing protein [Azonexus sp.]
RGESWPVTCAYSLHGVGEGGAGFVGQIPPLEAQAIYRRAGSQDFQTLPLKRQTLWFFPDRDVGAVLFTGLLDVDDMLGDEIDHLLVALSEFGTPYPLNYLSVVARRREDTSCNQIEGMRDEVLLPPASRGWAWEYLLLPEDHPRVAQPARAYARVRERMQHYLGMVAAAAEATDKAKEQDIAQVKAQTRALIRGEGLPETEADKMDWRRQLAAWPRDRRRDDLIIRNADLSGLDFSGQSWQGSQLINVDLSACRFVDVDLRNMLFLGCKLDGASFENAVLDSCHFSECSLSKSRWKATQLATVQLIECDFSASTVLESQWKTTFFSESRGSKLSFAKVAFDSVQMQKCAFPALSFADSTVDGHVFLDCQLPSLKISQSLWRKTSWVACKLPGSSFENSRFATAVLADACDISGARWTQCRFEKVFLGAAKFDGGVCESCTWVEASMNALKASGSQWIACDLRQGNLMHADFSASRFQSSALRDANLYGADLRASEVHSSNLIGANLGYVQREKNWQKKWKDNLMGRVIEVPRRQD